MEPFDFDIILLFYLFIHNGRQPEMMSKAIEVDSASKVHLEWNEFVRLIIPNRQSE